MTEHSAQFYAFGPFLLDARRRRLQRDGRPVALTPKALELLVALIEARDRVMEKEELLARVWPEQFVEEANLSVNMSALRRALGERASENQYVATIPRRGYRFVADVREVESVPVAVTETAAGETPETGERANAEGAGAPSGEETRAGGLASDEPHDARRAGTPNNLPVQLTPFVGRQPEADGVLKLLRRADVRLVTLTGPGGSGKTRLALHVASELLAEFADGVFFVDLDPINEPRLVASTIAQTLGVKEAGGTTLEESLKTYLRERCALILLDNFEQVVTAAPLIAALLGSTRRLKVLVTSRAVLHLTGEHEFQVPPLVVPDVRGLPPAHDLLRYSSVELFVQRASAARSDFRLTDRNAPAVAQICAHLDGLPLAIELAAARVRLLPPQAMLARLAAPLKLLTGGARDLPARQQTMSGAIAWSYDLLDEAGQRLFRRLSVFVGGATLEAAEAVCSDFGFLTSDGGAEETGSVQSAVRHPPSEIDIQEGVASLVDNSLLRQVEQPGGEPRFVLLETIREYGLEQLRASGELAAARRRHAEYFLRLGEQADAEMGGERLDYWLEQLEQEHDNLRAALAWSLEAGGDEASETGLRLVRSLWWFWYLHGHYNEGREWIDKVLAAGSHAPTTHRARALVGAGVLAFLQCEYESAERRLDEGLALARETGDHKGTAMALQVLGSVARERGRYDLAVTRHRESLSLWVELGDRRGVARSLNYIGFAAWLSGNFDETVRCCNQALDMFREQGDKEGLVWALLNLAFVARYCEDYDRTVALGGESLTLSREIGYKEGVAWSLNILGDATRLVRSYARSTAMLQESLHLHHELGDRWRVASVLESLAAVACETGRPERAALLFAAAESLRETTGTPLPPVEAREREPHVASMRVALGDEAADSLHARGRALPLDEIISSALELPEGELSNTPPADILEGL